MARAGAGRAPAPQVSGASAGGAAARRCGAARRVRVRVRARGRRCGAGCASTESAAKSSTRDRRCSAISGAAGRLTPPTVPTRGPLQPSSSTELSPESDRDSAENGCQVAKDARKDAPVGQKVGLVCGLIQALAARARGSFRRSGRYRLGSRRAAYQVSTVPFTHSNKLVGDRTSGAGRSVRGRAASR